MRNIYHDWDQSNFVDSKIKNDEPINWTSLKARETHLHDRRFEYNATKDYGKY